MLPLELTVKTADNNHKYLELQTSFLITKSLFLSILMRIFYHR